MSWLALCPDNDITGGRVAWRGMRRGTTGRGPIWNDCVYSASRPKPVGDDLRRRKSKLGPAGATTATAHKIATIFNTMVKNQVEHDDDGLVGT